VLLEKALADPRVGWLLLSSSGKSKETPASGGVGGPVSTWIARASHRGEGGRRLVVVDNRNEIRQFLTSRRAKITPEQAGLPTYGGNRRVAGLRREEVALLAGVSVDYYTRLERGNLGGVSEAVLDALARALQLDEAERGTCSTWPGRPTPPPGRVAGRAPSGSGRASSASWRR
jgi:Helix-turn-helix domain